jgi:hypothetical protein
VAIAIDTSGNQNTATRAITTNNGVIPADVVVPSAPGTLSNSVGTNTVQLSWLTATDAGSGVADYLVFRKLTAASFPTINAANATAITSTLSYLDVGLTPETGYDYRVYARDRAGNISTSFVSVSVTTTATAGEDPPAPAGVTFSDDFNDGIPDASKWVDSSGVTELGGRLVTPAT